ncbi:MAG: hypothetical protein V9H26_25325 [Verrucomicrobiota bacterium]
MRDVGEDLERGRVYLPVGRAGRARSDAEPTSSAGVVAARPASRPPWREQIARVRGAWKRPPAQGIAMLHPDVAAVHRGRARPRLRHRRRGGGPRLRGLRPPGHRAGAPPPRGGRARRGPCRARPPRGQPDPGTATPRPPSGGGAFDVRR